jgi:3-phenylpropionate/cinnamic acid dioxygenase small subunit
MGFVEDRLEILDLLARYAHAYDGGDRATLEALFTDDAEFHIHGNVGRVPATMVGRDAIVAALVRKWDVIRPEQRRHIATNLCVLEQGEATARAASYLVLIATSGGTPTVLATGRYEDDLVKGDDGRWRIHRRHATTDGDVP